MEKKITAELTLENIPEFFCIAKKNSNHEIRVGRSRPILVKFPIKLDEKLAKICAMLLDGSISKDLYNCIFYQKKDPTKVKEFASIIKKIFGIAPRFPKRHHPYLAVFGNKTLAYFLHYCLDMYKCDESARIPKWIWNSSQKVMKEYLRYAFAMEGSVTDPKIRNKEIRFHSCDESYIKELSKFLKEKFSINSKITKYFIKNYGWKYYLFLNSEKEIIKFIKIGFALESHQRRLEEILNLCKPKAWETTLVTLFNFNKNKLSIGEIETAFQYLKCRRSVHERLSHLIRRGYISHKRNSYSLTEKGKVIALSLKRNIKIVPLRTNPLDNEKRILEFISINKKSYRNQIARSLGIPVRTVNDVLKRLTKKEEIEQVGKDKIGRKFWIINNSLE